MTLLSLPVLLETAGAGKFILPISSVYLLASLDDRSLYTPDRVEEHQVTGAGSGNAISSVVSSGGLPSRAICGGRFR
jgi:hypothetical protein